MFFGVRFKVVPPGPRSDRFISSIRGLDMTQAAKNGDLQLTELVQNNLGTPVGLESLVETCEQCKPARAARGSKLQQSLEGKECFPNPT